MQKVLERPAGAGGCARSQTVCAPRAVLGLGQAVVVASPRAAAGELDAADADEAPGAPRPSRLNPRWNHGPWLQAHTSREKTGG